MPLNARLAGRIGAKFPLAERFSHGLQEYRATASVQRYVMLDQTNAAAIVFRRKDDDWVSEIIAGDGAVLRMPEIGVDVPLAELYEGVELTGTVDTGEGG